MTDALLDTLRKMDAEATKGPWMWEVSDYSMAELHGPRIEDCVMCVSPCEPCLKRIKKEADESGIPATYLPGRCTTPNAANSTLIVATRNALPELVAVIEAADAMRRDALAHNEEYHAGARYDAARAALAAKIEGAGR